jgi:hypothetical protein
MGLFNSLFVFDGTSKASTAGTDKQTQAGEINFGLRR